MAPHKRKVHENSRSPPRATRAKDSGVWTGDGDARSAVGRLEESVHGIGGECGALASGAVVAALSDAPATTLILLIACNRAHYMGVACNALHEPLHGHVMCYMRHYMAM